MQLKSNVLSVKFQVLSVLLAYGILHLAPAVYAEDKVSIKLQRYEDDKSLYYKNTDGTRSERWLLSVVKAISERTSLALNYGVDAVSSASWKIDAVTSASKRAGEETRYTGGFGLNHTIGTMNLSVNAGVGRENNYNSDYISAAVTKDYNKRNTTVALSVSQAWDDIYSEKKGDTREYPEKKDTSTIGISLTQTLTPWTVASIGHEYTMVDGYQAHPENVVQLSNGAFADELHPETRYRNASVIRLNQYLPWRGAVHADYRYYNDSWGLDSNTLGLKYYQYINKGLIVRARYRYYSQGAADFYSENPTAADKYPTIDGKLRKFDSEMYGVKAIADITKTVQRMGLKGPEKITFDVKYDYYHQLDGIATGSDGLKADIVQVGLGMEF